ncbi:PKD domain-containing protein [Lutibacter oricola]|uniref:PKD domain-containing protein n=1 Tax=Lutibacter oricola TaxID=762486 RepID=A0A1H3FSF2_9FLAO|nr:PKD domain-containing protein [Lutibacter oricola]SDX93737.1 PKD domain-containing protein [Lutibacter oricola]
MIKIKNNIKQLKSQVIMASLLVMAVVMTSCDFEFDLPEEGSIADLTPPTASFESKVSPENNLKINFTNLSGSSTDYVWEFGDGNSSTDKEPSHTYDAIGTYTVMLTATDKIGASSSVTGEVIVEEKQVIKPEILEAGFEDNTLPDGTGDGRDSWRNDFGGVIQITSSPVNGGTQAAKFPSAGDRVGHQEVLATPDTDYILTYYYTMKTSGTGNLTVRVLGGSISDLDEADGATLASHVGTNQDSSSTYVKVEIPFNTGSNSVVGILITNEGVESRVDDMEITIK